MSLKSNIKNSMLSIGGLRSFALALACAVLISPTPALAGPDLVGELLRRQENLSTVRAAFVQNKHTAMLDNPIRSGGTFLFKLGKGVRWEYEDVLVVYDGSVLFVYSPELGEAEKIKGKEGFMGPLAFDVEKLVKDYDVKASEGDGAISLVLKPRDEMPFREMVMSFRQEDAFPADVTITEETGDRTVIEFSDVEINGRLDNSLFTFTPPPGTVVRERSFE